MTHRIVLLTGSNAPDKAEMLRRAAALAEQRIGPAEAVSEPCASEPWGFEAESDFLNQALVLRTELEPERALDELQRIEIELGRMRPKENEEKARTGQRYASRTIDIDIMFYDDLAIDTPRLKVPHPLLHLREFALRPLCMIMGDYVHPTARRTLRGMLDDLRHGATADNENKDTKI